MPNIIDILARALSLRQETALNSITPNRAGGIMYDTLLVLNQMQLEGGSLLISKVYASVSAMEADTTPTSDLTGRALKPGQLVVIVTSDSSSSDMGSEYRFNGPGSWTYVGKVGGLPLDTVPTQSSTKGITSGGVYTALAAMNAEGYKYMGLATPGSGGTAPGTPNQPVFYIAGPGSYPNFGSITVASGYLGFIKYSSGSWTVESVAVGKDYDEQISSLDEQITQLEAKVTGIVDTGLWEVGSVNYPSEGHIPSYPSGRRMRTAELIIQQNGKYTFKCNSGYRFSAMIIGVQETLVWETEHSWDLTSGTVYRVVLREEPDPEDTNKYNNYTQEQIDALVSASGFELEGPSILSPLEREVSGIEYKIDGIISNSVVYSGNQEKQVLTNLAIPSGVPVKVKVSAPNISWSRAGLSFNGAWTLGDGLIDNVVKDVEYELPGRYALSSVYFYIISGFSGSGNVTVTVEDSRAVLPRINALESGEPIGTDKIMDDAVTMAKLGDGAAETVASKNLCDKTAFEDGYYFALTKTANPDYAITGRIKVTQGAKYYISGSSARMVAFLETETSERALSYTEYPSNPVTIPEQANYIIVTFVSSAKSLNLQIEEGETPTAYEPYFEPYKQIYLRDKQVTKDKLADDALVAPPAFQFKRLFAEENEIAAGSSVKIQNINISKDFTLSAKIIGAINSVLVGFAYLGFYGRWVEITPTQLIIHTGTSGTIAGTYQHGLTLGGNTTFLLDRDLGNCTITLINDNGELFRQAVSWDVNPGSVFVRNNNASGTIEASISFVPKDINEKIWMFGDSYFSYADPARWTYYAFQWGYTKPLMDARGGENSGEALNDFLNLLSLGARPTYALWALGMNDGTDSQSAPSTTWLTNIQAFLEKCNEKGITPILCTIPTIPSLDHSQKSAWVRNSGYRYIDMAAAVEESGTTYWKGWGAESAFLSSDETHPTIYGAKALVAQVMVDFPEIAVF